MRTAINTLDQYRVRLDKAIVAETAAEAKRVAHEQDKLAGLNADVAEARARLATTSDRVADAAREFASGTGRGLLLRFVRARATDGQYARHLGLVASIRRDFTELSAMMADADENIEKESERQSLAYHHRVELLIQSADRLLGGDDVKTLRASADAPTIERASTFQIIILYIDDLDRCPPPKVVDVLQAVHLLLTFPLFVVVVAVDVRWVGRSLETHYLNLLRPDDGATSGASARDYL